MMSRVVKWMPRMDMAVGNKEVVEKDRRSKCNFTGRCRRARCVWFEIWKKGVPLGSGRGRVARR